MDPERWQQIDQLFHSALKCEPAARAAFLQASIEDEALRHEVESLVESHEQSDGFIEEPANDLAAELLAGEDEALAEGQAVGPYKILSLFGEGGMGEVYLAQDERLGRQVALKLLPAQFTRDADRVCRFEQEARAVSALNHPNIVTIHEIGDSKPVLSNSPTLSTGKARSFSTPRHYVWGSSFSSSPIPELPGKFISQRSVSTVDLGISRSTYR